MPIRSTRKSFHSEIEGNSGVHRKLKKKGKSRLKVKRNWKRNIIVILIGFAVAGCGNGRKEPAVAEGKECTKEIRKEELSVFLKERNSSEEGMKILSRQKLQKERETGEEEDSETERRMRQLGLVGIREVDSSIQVRLVYATPDNFVGKVLYRDIRKAFLLPEAALRLADAQKRLKALRPDLGLLVYDAARPLSVQREMWEIVKGTDKKEYVSNPKHGGGLHNYGAAVDVTLVDSLGNTLPMGSSFDYFGEEARPDRENSLLKQGKIILPHLRNRLLLRRVMKEAGFRPLPSEWWHFNLMSREEAKTKLPLIE